MTIAHSSVAELHAFWDDGCGASGLERIRRMPSGGMDLAAVAELAKELIDDEASAIASKTSLTDTAAMSAALKSWIYESFALAQNSSYSRALMDDLAQGTAVSTRAPFWPGYASASSEVVRSRLRLGGARLAAVLNALYDPSAGPPVSAIA